MKIGIDARLWNESGVGRYIRNLVLGLESLKTGHEFIIFLNANSFNDVEFQNPKFKKVKADIPWHTAEEQFKFKKIIDGEKVDLMHFPYFSYPVFYRKPFVITIHDLIIDHFPTGKSSSLPLPIYYFKRFAYKEITKRAIRNSEKIIVPSFATKSEIISHYKADGDKINVIHEGFDKLISKKGNKAELVSKNYILYVGNAYPHKNLESLILAYKKLRKTEDIDLICIGKKDFFYEKFTSEIFPGIYFLHNIEDFELFDYYTNARCIVIPSFMEGFGLPLLEAMSLSCPVLSSETKALKEIGGEAALYFDPKDVSDIENSIRKILKDEKLRQELIKKGILQSKKYSWEKCINETLKIYESCDSLRQG